MYLVSLNRHPRSSDVFSLSAPVGAGVGNTCFLILLPLPLSLKGVAWEGTHFRAEDEMLVGRAGRIVVKTLDEAVGAAERDVVESADGEGGLGVRGWDEAFFYNKTRCVSA